MAGYPVASRFQPEPTDGKNEIAIFIGLIVLLGAILLFIRLLAKKRSEFQWFGDQYSTVEDVQADLRKSGLESCNMILGVDFTKSNEWTGARSFGGHSLHFLSSVSKNPYEAVISIICRTLSSFDEDMIIPAYGFGDMVTQDRDVFPLNPNGSPCRGFEEALHFYSLQAQQRRLSGPTSFAPLISRAVQIVRERRTYHILVIIADGQVEDSGATVAAIVRASEYPLSIVMVGVGDGPWDIMRAFDDELPDRTFDNFQFVPFTAHMTEAAFALAALQEIPQQYNAICKLGLLERLRRSARIPSISSETMPHAYPPGAPVGGPGLFGAYSPYAPSAPPPPR